MTREEAIEVIKRTKGAMVYTEKEKEALETLIPELAESEDERIRKALIEVFKKKLERGFEWVEYGIPNRSVLDWLEKQKENPKSADSIPSDCVSGVKYEDRWHKVTDSLPDNPREVLCKDEAGNYFIGRYYVDEGWEISNYDDEDKPHHLNPPVLKWIDFPLEKQKESLRDFIDDFPYSAEQKEEKPSIFPPGFGEVRWNPISSVQQKPVEWSNEDEARIERIAAFMWRNRKGDTDDIYLQEQDVAWLKSLPKRFNLQPKQEWSEEDERMLSRCVKSIESSKQFADSDTFKKAKDNEIDWLENRIKSFRPVKQEWSKEDEKMLKWAIRIIVEYSDIDEEGSEIVQNWLESLRPQYHGDVTMTEAYKMGKEAGEASHWKPSEEQMDRLFSIVAALRKDYCDDMADFLANLYADLKKLGVKEEPEYYQHFDPDC